MNYPEQNTSTRSVFGVFGGARMCVCACVRGSVKLTKKGEECQVTNGRNTSMASDNNIMSHQDPENSRTSTWTDDRQKKRKTERSH